MSTDDPPVPGERADVTSAQADTATFGQRLGRCYELAFKVGSASAQGHIVHGSIERAPNPRIGHAWLENGERVYDPITDRTMSWREWKAWAKAKRARKYPVAEAVELAVGSGHAGPWHPAPFGTDD